MPKRTTFSFLSSSSSSRSISTCKTLLRWAVTMSLLAAVSLSSLLASPISNDTIPGYDSGLIDLDFPFAESQDYLNMTSKSISKQPPELDLIVHPTSTIKKELLPSSSSISFSSTPNSPTPIARKIHTEKVVIYSILFVISSIGNTTSFIALLFMNRLNRSQNFTRIRMLFMNLCIADLMVTYIHLPLEIIWAYTDTWLAGELMCKLMMFLRTFGLYLSSFIIITITVDRFYVIVKPLELDRVYRLNKILIAMSWTVSFLSSLPQVYVFEILQHPQDPTFEQCVTFGKLNTRTKKIVYNLYHFIGCYGLPLLIMIYCYAKIFSTITTHSKNKQKYHELMRNGNSNNANQQLTAANEEENNGDKQQSERRSCAVIMGRNSSNSSFAPSVAAMKRASSNSNRTTAIGRVNENPSDEFDSNNNAECVSFNKNQYSKKTIAKLIPENEFIRRNTNKTYLKAKFRTLRLSALIVIAFLFSWTPYYICVLWAIISPESFNVSATNKKISNYLFTFAVSNSCFNPIVYGIFSNKLYQFLPCLQKREDKKKKEVVFKRKAGSVMSRAV